VTRKFTSSPAVRGRTQLLLALIGPTGTGKTFSALRLAEGMKRVTGGETFVIDTEAGRAKHYAKDFKFHHVPFEPPYPAVDYMDAIDHAVAQGAKRIIIDSMTHEHTGVGGMLEQHEAEWTKKGHEDKYKLGCWAKPKHHHRAMIEAVLRAPVDFFFCFRAKDKVKPEKGKGIEELGCIAIGDEEFLFEMTVNFLFLPNGNKGVPVWTSKMKGEIATIKLPGQFEALFAGNPRLDENIGEALARWGMGEDLGAPAAPVPLSAAAEDLVKRYGACADAETYRTLGAAARAAWSTFTPAEKSAINAANEATRHRAKRATESKPAESEPSDPEPSSDEKGAA
jgi:hypothetical protein